MGLINIYRNLESFPYIKRALVRSSLAPGGIGHIGRIVPLLVNLERNEQKRKNTSMVHGVPVPQVCILSVTRKCNLQCPDCYDRAFPGDKTMSMADIRSAIEKLLASGTSVFAITGGEPFMVRDIIPALGSIRKGLFLVFTNGTLIGDPQIRKLRRFTHVVPVISYEGSDELTDTRRGASVGMNARSVMKKMLANRVAFGISMMVTHQNAGLVLSGQLFRNLEEWGASILFLVNYYSPCGVDGSDLALTAADRVHITAMAERQKKESRLIVVNMTEDECPDGSCAGGGKGLIYIDAAGRVGPCPFLNNTRHSILDRNYIDILKSEPLVSFRQHVGHAGIKPCQADPCSLSMGISH